MSRLSLNLKSIILVNSAITLLYLGSIVFSNSAGCIVSLLVLSEVALVWMVIRILKDPWTTDKTFDEYFYEDREDIRRSEPE